MIFTMQELDYIISWALTAKDFGDEWPSDEEALITRLQEERNRIEMENAGLDE